MTTNSPNPVDGERDTGLVVIKNKRGDRFRLDAEKLSRGEGVSFSHHYDNGDLIRNIHGELYVVTSWPNGLSLRGASDAFSNHVNVSLMRCDVVGKNFRFKGERYAK